jgi:tRNA wybutosine-synthesizing protein 3
MSFETDKKNILGRIDKSKKGEIDPGIREICELLNAKPNYYTTSSCSGRIVLLQKKSDLKNEAEWIFTAHEETDFGPVKSALLSAVKQSNAPLPETDIWFKQEGAILHVCCRTMKDAGSFVNIARNSGFKRAGIISAGETPVVEIISSEQINAPAMLNGKIIAEDNYFRALVSEADRKIRKNREKLKTLEKNLRNL